MAVSIACIPESSCATHTLSACLQRVLPNARAELSGLPSVPELSLYLLNADFCSAELSQDEMLAVLNYPAYWAFCWASGQVMARWLLDNPQWLAGKTVLDFGCGSGVAAIAAAKAGAARVIACDLDPDALLATRCNAAHNGVELALCADFAEVSEPVDIILVADVLYDRANLGWLPRFRERAAQVLVADSRVKNFSAPGYRRLGAFTGTTWPDLDEFDEFRSVQLYLGER